MRFARNVVIGVAILLGLTIALLVGSVGVDYAIGGSRLESVTNTSVPGANGLPNVRAWVARPTTPGPRPVVIMIHEFYGLNQSIVSKADLLAQEGFLVIAPDTFRGSTTEWIPRAIYQTLTADPAVVNADLDSVFAWLATEPGADPTRVAITGFCYGGRTSLLYSLHSQKMAATAVFYGSPVTDPVRLKTLRGPVLGIFGGADSSISQAQVDAFRQGLVAAGVPSNITVYDGQPHAFVENAAGIKAGGVQAKAWNQMVAFLHDNLDRKTAMATNEPSRPDLGSIGHPVMYLLSLAFEHGRGHGNHLQ